MGRTSLLFVVLFISVVPATFGLAAEVIRETPLLRDGFVMMGVEGKLIVPDGNDVWFFELASDVNDYSTVIKAGTRLELLPSAALERMTADKKMRATAVYRLWNSRVTRYKGRNFIFPGYFIPLSKAEEPEPSQQSQHKQQEPDRIQTAKPREQQLELDEPNDVLSMPQEIIEKLRAKRERTDVSKQPIADGNEVLIDKSQPAAEEQSPVAQSYARSTDLVFVDRTGFLIEQEDGRLVFAPDALGRNVQKLSLHLLPCAVLELAESEQAAEPEKVRFKIAGIITKYKGDNYLLLEKAIPAYSHGNFGR